MPYFDLGDEVKLYYQEQGEGQPILFIHGVWMSGRFFERQLSYFGQRHRAIALDLRGHGRSQPAPAGHTVAGYARDVRAFIDHLGLKEVILVGWSMGCFVIWDYFDQFGPQNIKATVLVEETPSDYQWPDWPLGFAGFDDLREIMSTVQTDRAAFVREFIALMFKEAPSEADFEWIFEEITRPPECIASAIIFDQTVQDYRPVVPKVSVPSLLCFGRDEKLIPIAGGEYLAEHMPEARLVVFEESGHCPFLEETERFNQEVERFIQSLG